MVLITIRRGGGGTENASRERDG